MNSYLSDTKNAATGLINLIKNLDDELYGIYKEYERLKEGERVLHELFMGNQLEDDCMFRFTQATKAREDAKKAFAKLTEYENKALFNETALASICGALLQVAKHGMSQRHKKIEDYPNAGRMIGSQCLATVVWQARNQSSHFEEGNNNLRKWVKMCFKELENDIGPQFSFQGYPQKNMAWEIVKELEWTSYNMYQTDMESLLK